MPILKQLVSNSSQSKRRSRADLTAEMISAPLGDFRHTMHVGRGGDAFGDTSFLSSRSGEAPREAEVKPSSPGLKPGLLARTFRSSKRSHSVNRADSKAQVVAGSSPNLVKNAVSMPYLNDEATSQGGGSRLPKSVSSSPLKKLPECDEKPVNGAAALATLDLDLDEKNFGELMELPPSAAKMGGMKHAESIMSFHVDLGPSMLGDILSVMEKRAWEEDDQGYEEGESRGSPFFSPLTKAEEKKPPARPPRSMQQQTLSLNPYTPELRTRKDHVDSSSVSSSGSAVEDKQLYHLYEGDTDSARFSSPRRDDDRDFTFMDEDDDEDEIRV